MYNYWVKNIGAAFPEFQPDHRPEKLNQPISEGCFQKQFNAESITYEVGDNTPIDFISKKGETAAMEMMKLMIMR